MSKEYKVIMLSTNDNYSGLNIDPHNNNKLSIESNTYCCKKPQHLYITSDDEIKVGDWYLANDCNHKNDTPIYIVRKCDNITNGWLESNSNIGQGDNPDWSSKIIATTDKSLTIKEYSGVIDESNGVKESWDNLLPQIPQQFIEKYIEEYNKGNVIDKVLVECEVNDQPLNKMELYFIEENILTEEVIRKSWYSKLKLNPDNTINIFNKKESWNREEVIELIKDFSLEFCDSNSKYLLKNFDRWIEENL